MNTVMNLRDPYNLEKFLSGCTIDGFSIRAQLCEVSYFFQQIHVVPATGL
jgi:hypothetical protein